MALWKEALRLAVLSAHQRCPVFCLRVRLLPSVLVVCMQRDSACAVTVVFVGAR